MTQKFNRGFTLIELLVVIAIIGILSSVVLASLNNARGKGKDAAIKGNMATVLTNMAVWYDGNGDYSGFTADATYTVPAGAITNAGKTVISGSKTDTDDQFCACSTLYDTTLGTYCVDHTGYKNQTATACATRCTSGTTTANGKCSN